MKATKEIKFGEFTVFANQIFFESSTLFAFLAPNPVLKGRNKVK